MARKVRNSTLESRTSRLSLPIRGKPYPGPSLARGIKLDYRRNKTNGSWVLEATDGHGKPWTKAFAHADDFDDRNGETILDFYQAQDRAKKLARGEDDSAGAAPVTVEAALVDYRADLITFSSNPYNADWPLLHLAGTTLKSKPVALLTSKELKAWRDGLIGTMAPSTINRLCGCLRAALNLAARHDKRIKNRDAWEIGLVNLPDAQQARNVVLANAKVSEFVAAAYGIDEKFGLFTDTLAVTGARPSQARRLRVEDLHDHPLRPKLMMPKAGKGGSRKRAEKKQQRYSVPITPELAARLKAAAKGRADHAPLLLQGDGSPWGDNPGAGYHNDVKKIVAAIGADPKATMYALRHSSIVRQLLKNVPVRLVAELHNTSTKMVEQHYSKYITEHSDDISRHALLRHEPLTGGNVVALR